MLTEAILQTKLQPPPPRRALVSRPGLTQKLQNALTFPLTLVSAPAGFGKTTAIAAAVRALQDEPDVLTAWLSLEERDNEPDRFWHYFFAAVETAVSLPTPLAASLTQPQPPPVPALLTTLLNQIAALPQQLLLVLDDLYLIQQPDVHRSLALLLKHAPPNLHLLLGTRADPPLPLHRLRAGGQLLEVRAEDLRFDAAEASAFLQQVAPTLLTAAEQALLYRQTEGWVVGLQLAAHALPATRSDQHTFLQRLDGTNRYILEYLTEEVLDRQPPPVQSFLLQTAILDRLCASLCDAVTGTEGSEAMLARLARQNLFLLPFTPDGPVATAVSWYRYHHLFAALLQGHLQQQQPDQMATLHRRAAGWFAAQGDVETAVAHAFAAADYPLVARLMEENARDILMQGQALMIEGWLQRLPPRFLDALPRTSLTFVEALLLRGRFQDVEPYLQRAEASSLASADPAFLGEIHTLRATVAETRGDAAAALTHARLALDAIPEDDLVLQGLVHFALAGALRETGDVQAATAAYEHAIPLCRAARLPLLEMLARAHLSFLCALRGQLNRVAATARPALAAGAYHPAVGAVYATLGMVELERNRLDEAEKLLQQAMERVSESGHNATAIHVHILRNRLLSVRGEVAAAQQALQDATVLLERGAPAWLDGLLNSRHVQFWLAQDDVTTAARLPAQSVPPRHMEDLLHLAQARIDLYRGTPATLAEAERVLTGMLETAVADGRNGVVIEARMLRALLLADRGDAETARADLGTAVSLAAPEGYVLLFVEAGVPLAKLLVQLKHPYARTLLDAFPAQVVAEVTAVSPLPEPLTEREADVLHLMAHGLTYKQIAAELVVSVNTVRHHVKGLYSKLGVGSRAQAVEKARQLRLI